jgi:hypothetical protein
MPPKPKGSNVVVAGGLDEARAYVAPTTVPPKPRHKTLEAIKVRIAPEADPRKALTQRNLAAPTAPIPAGRAGAKAEGDASPWGAGPAETIDPSLLPSSHAPGRESPSSRPPAGIAVPVEAEPPPRRPLGVALVAVLAVAALVGAIVALGGPKSGTTSATSAARATAAPVASTAPSAGATTAETPPGEAPTAKAAATPATTTQARAGSTAAPSARAAEPDRGAAPRAPDAPAEPKRPELYE